MNPQDALASLMTGGGAGETKRRYPGTFRAVEPSATLRRVRPLLERIGATRVADVTGLDYVGIPVFAVYRPNSRSLVVSQGKGVDALAAEVSAIVESLELYHAERLAQPVLRDSPARLAARAALADPAVLPLHRKGRLDPTAETGWVAGFDLLRQEPTWVPFDLVHVDLTGRLSRDPQVFLTSTNGIAAGNTITEAVLHALCEVVERDAQALVAACDRRFRFAGRPRVALDDVEEADCRMLVEACRAAGLHLEAWDITSDLGIACFYCRVSETATARHRLCGPADGSGCHPSRAVALVRAVTEALQTRLVQIAGARDDILPFHYGEPAAPDGEATASRGHGGARDLGLRAVPDFLGRSFVGDLGWVLDQLRGAGVEQVVAVDLSRQDIGLPVVRVVVPGLEGMIMARGYVPGARARAAMQAACR